MAGTIYFHTHRESGKVYVGQTWNYSRRTRGKAWDYRGSHHMFHAFQKYGWDAFDHQIICDGIETQEELDNLEKVWIILFQSSRRKFGYNLRLGGARGKASLETIEKLRPARLKPNAGWFKPGHSGTRGYTGHPANSGSFKPGKRDPLPAEQKAKMSATRKAWWDKKRGLNCQN